MYLCASRWATHSLDYRHAHCAPAPSTRPPFQAPRAPAGWAGPARPPPPPEAPFLRGAAAGAGGGAAAPENGGAVGACLVERNLLVSWGSLQAHLVGPLACPCHSVGSWQALPGCYAGLGRACWRLCPPGLVAALLGWGGTGRGEGEWRRLLGGSPSGRCALGHPEHEASQAVHAYVSVRVRMCSCVGMFTSVHLPAFRCVHAS